MKHHSDLGRFTTAQWKLWAEMTFALLATLPAGARAGTRMLFLVVAAFEALFQDAEARPAVPTLGKLSGQCRRTVQEHLDKLHVLRRVVTYPGLFGVHIYRCCFDGADSMPRYASPSAKSAESANPAHDQQQTKRREQTEITAAQPWDIHRVIPNSFHSPERGYEDLELLVETDAGEEQLESYGGFDDLLEQPPDRPAAYYPTYAEALDDYCGLPAPEPKLVPEPKTVIPPAREEAEKPKKLRGRVPLWKAGRKPSPQERRRPLPIPPEMSNAMMLVDGGPKLMNAVQNGDYDRWTPLQQRVAFQRVLELHAKDGGLRKGATAVFRLKLNDLKAYNESVREYDAAVREGEIRPGDYRQFPDLKKCRPKHAGPQTRAG